jgi:hypothetical protein
MSLFGRNPEGPQVPGPSAQSADEQAIARYRYMLKTAPPETIEQAHAEAFAQLTPEQRRMVLQQMAANLPAAERALAERSGAEPQALARVATRAEIRQPGAMERMFGQAGGMSFGGVMASSLLGSIAGTAIGSAIAREFFSGDHLRAAGGNDVAQLDPDAGADDTDQPLDDGGGFAAGGDSFDTGGFEDV